MDKDHRTSWKALPTACLLGSPGTSSEAPGCDHGCPTCRSAIINVSTLLSSITTCPENFSVSPMYPYRVSKAALNMLTRCLAEDLKKDGILVMSLHPGWVQTEMGGPKAPLTTAESISGMMKVITSLTEKDTGTLLDWEGKNIPW
ncbi:hypothetical protein cypCar_00042131 [Cyprinus carpio]|nr:hypothetical protein cypCar_00042131 [Cyprinus carpio]